jgi:pimeloyl-ACP methyl ester carboxylesterase
MGQIAAAGFGAAAVLREDVMLAQNTRFRRLPAWQEPRVKGFKNLGGNNVYYEEYGQGVPLVLTPGGQSDAETTRGVSEKLASKFRVIAWDRANVGYSDVVFKGARDVDLWSDQLAELLGSLKAAPACLASCSGGMRTAFTPLCAIRTLCEA